MDANSAAALASNEDDRLAEAEGRRWWSEGPRVSDYETYDCVTLVELRHKIDSSNPGAAPTIGDDAVKKFFRNTKHPFGEIDVVNTEIE